MTQVLTDRIERILPTVQKPGRYTGGELNQVVKNWDEVQTRLALVFPDLYDLGMSNLGLTILYDAVNQRPDACAERAFAPWLDMEQAMRLHAIPLFSLETHHPLSQFDIIGFSLPYETLYTNTLNLLDLAGLPLYAAERNEEHPLVIAGGHAVHNPEPMHAFIDAFVVGEGEEVIHEIIQVHQAWKARRSTRQDLLESLAQIWGVYVPSFYQVTYHPDGTVQQVSTTTSHAALPVIKRIVPKLPPPVTRFIVPYIDTVHNRVAIEIMRGCTRGCRFCHAGMITRPVRQRPVDEVLSAIETALAQTGYEEVGLLSLSSSDYTHILELVTSISQRFEGKHLNVSLPSLRIDSFSVDLMDSLRDSRRSGFTLAPEAATERMREIINKPVSTEKLLDTAREIFRRGWHNLKLYFMIGHPSETIEDVQAIADLCKAVLAVGRQTVGGRAQVTAGVSTFIPKPHTPFQWVSCDTFEQIEAKQTLLKQALRAKNLKLNWNPPETTMLEAWLSRGDRRMAQVIYQAWKLGAKFDAWDENFRYDLWLQAFQVVGLEPSFYTHRTRPLDEVFPWEHISTSVRKNFLAEDYRMSIRGETRSDCRQNCYACGILPTFADMRRANPGEVWQCPEVNTKKIPVAQLPQPPSLDPTGCGLEES